MTAKPRIEDILVAVGDHFGCTVAELKSRRRGSPLPIARGVAVELIRRHTIASYPEIARALGRTNHSTVITAHRRHQRRLAGRMSRADAAAIRAVVEIEQSLGLCGRKAVIPS
jgi:chromosomal replication initiation ATPase DnaA